jgi:hypothetical protein
MPGNLTVNSLPQRQLVRWLPISFASETIKGFQYQLTLIVRQGT